MPVSDDGQMDNNTQDFSLIFPEYCWCLTAVENTKVKNTTLGHNEKTQDEGLAQ